MLYVKQLMSWYSNDDTVPTIMDFIENRDDYPNGPERYNLLEQYMCDFHHNGINGDELRLLINLERIIGELE